VNLTLKGELEPLGLEHPTLEMSGGVNSVWPSGSTSPLGANFTTGGQILPLGPRFENGLRNYFALSKATRRDFDRFLDFMKDTILYTLCTVIEVELA
jgi:hypothetical protein